MCQSSLFLHPIPSTYHRNTASVSEGMLLTMDLKIHNYLYIQVPPLLLWLGCFFSPIKIEDAYHLHRLYG